MSAATLARCMTDGLHGRWHEMQADGQGHMRLQHALSSQPLPCQIKLSTQAVAPDVHLHLHEIFVAKDALPAPVPT